MPAALGGFGSTKICQWHPKWLQGEETTWRGWMWSQRGAGGLVPPWLKVLAEATSSVPGMGPVPASGPGDKEEGMVALHGS